MTDSEIRKQVYIARDMLINEIKKELLGPGSEHSIPDAEHEIITDLPEVRYSVGILFPQKERYGADNDDTARLSERGDEIEIDEVNDNSDDAQDSTANKQTLVNNPEEDSLDEEISLASQNLPSSMGFTFFVQGDGVKISLHVSFGTYRKAKLEDCVVHYKPLYDGYELPIQFQQYTCLDAENSLLHLSQPLKKKYVYDVFNSDDSITEGVRLKESLIMLCNQFGANGFVRVPHDVKVIVDFSSSDYIDNIKELDGTSAKITALRKRISDDVYSITIMLVNEATGRYNGRNSIFQPVIRIDTAESSPYRFCEYTELSNAEHSDEEELSLALLYRKKKIYGTGHGTSVNWQIDSEGCGYIENGFFPQNEVPQMDFSIMPDSGINPKCLSMKYLSDLDNSPMSDKIAVMKTMIDSYLAWIEDLVQMSGDDNIVKPQYQAKAREHIENCRETCNRMQDGLSLLENPDNEIVRNAFQLSNRAMFMQRIHLKIQEVDKYPNDIELQDMLSTLDYYTVEDVYSWRPFQLAFLLMSLKSIVDTESSERDFVDLIWFPTGGGKTEAYLGLTAFTIFYRRMAYPSESGGTAVIMRYTLRLLAAQQFVRAATLICACEAIRKDSERRKIHLEYSLGKETISIGLWIGGDHTPNKNDIAKDKLNKLKSSSDIRFGKDRYNKFQILKCPWCGTKMVKDIDPSTRKPIGDWGYRLKNNRYFYLCCTQEDCEYNAILPIQVVDEELYSNPPTLLFGTVDKFAMLPWKNDVGAFFATGSENRTPELIIQDELHLISGPLGTLVGLYETAVDALCSAKGIKPKIIASTATIRNAKEQCSVLYNREVRQFPPPGINAEDSFFAREANIVPEEYKYGRIYVGIMPSGKTKAMMEIRAIAAVLQRVDMLNCSDEVKDKFWTLAIYFNSLRDLGKCRTMIDDDVKDFIKRTAYRFGIGRGRVIGTSAELTSRISTSELNETLEKLERVEYSKENIVEKKYAINTLLGTNMISVGVDVARLNVMIIVGQPKLTSEYIQASSRIGRSFPGVAITLYDGTKSRDRSHYEQFKAYHDSFYKFVEPTGATPFSKPARDRALHAVVVSMVRHLYGLPLDTDAVLFDKDYLHSDLDKMKDYIIKRVERINERTWNNLDNDTNAVSDSVDEIIFNWHTRVQIADRKNFFYGDRYMVQHPTGDAKRLLKVFGSADIDPAYETLTSMRNVDKSIAANILIWEDDI